MEEGFTVLVDGSELVSGADESGAVEAIEQELRENEDASEDDFEVYEVVSRSVSIETERTVTIY